MNDCSRPQGLIKARCAKDAGLIRGFALYALALLLVLTTRAQGAITLTVIEAWGLAETGHPRVVEARERLVSLQRDVEQREAAYWPTLTVGGTGLSVHIEPDGLVGKVTPGAQLSAGLKLPSGLSFSASMSARSQSSAPSSITGSVQMSYPLWRSAALESDALSLRQAETAFVAARRQFEQLRDEVRAEVLAALHAEQLAAVRLQFARDDYAEAQQGWVSAQERAAAGISGEAELIGAQIDLLRAEQEHITASRTWATRRRQLGDLLGLDNVDAYEFQAVLAWTALPGFLDPDSAAAQAVEQSVTVWERLEAEAVARLQLQEERDRSPLNASLDGSYRSPGLDTGPGSSNAGWNIGLTVSYPLADGGQRRRAIEGREEALVRARQSREAAEQDVRDQVQELFADLHDALRAVEIAELELTRARLELSAVKRQAQLAVATVDEQTVLQSERSVTRAELNKSEAIQRYQASWLALQRLQGPVSWQQLIEVWAAPTEAAGSQVGMGLEGSD